MIYQPSPNLFNVYLALGQTALAVLVRFAADYTQRKNEPWAYYVGYGLSSAAMAGGIKNSALQIVGLATAVDAAVRIFFEESPGAAEVEIFLDGVSQAVLDLNGVGAVIDLIVNLPNDGMNHTIDIVNLGSAIGVSNPTDWLSVLQIETTSTELIEQGVVPMSNFIISFRIQDAKSAATSRVRNVQSASFFVPASTYTLADITAYHNALAAAVDAVSEGVIIDSSIQLSPTLPAGLKSSAVANSDVQEGGLIGYSVNGSNYRHSIRIPAFVSAKFVGAALNLTDSDVVALEELLNGTTQTNGKAIKASDQYSNEIVAAIAGSKSFRK